MYNCSVTAIDLRNELHDIQYAQHSLAIHVIIIVMHIFVMVMGIIRPEADDEI